MELCTGGSLLQDFHTQEKDNLTENESRHYFTQILNGIAYLHDKNIVHRNISMQNILLKNKTTNKGIIKIIDFREAVYFRTGRDLPANDLVTRMTSWVSWPLKKSNWNFWGNQNSESVSEGLNVEALTEIAGNSFFIAPEVLDEYYNEKCDIWSCGVILYVLQANEFPFEGENWEVLEKIANGLPEIEGAMPDGKVLGSRSDMGKQLIKKLMTFEVNKRVSADKGLKHGWFKQKYLSNDDDMA